MEQKTKTRDERLEEIRWGIILVGLVSAAPKFSNELADAAAWIAIGAAVVVREGVVSALERIWQFITRQ